MDSTARAVGARERDEVAWGPQTVWGGFLLPRRDAIFLRSNRTFGGAEKSEVLFEGECARTPLGRMESEDMELAGLAAFTEPMRASLHALLDDIMAGL